MRIGVNLLPLVPGAVGGIKQHVIGLLENLLKTDHNVSYVYYINSGLRDLFPAGDPRIRLVELPWNSREIAWRYLHGEFDVLFAPLMDPGVDLPLYPMVTLLVDLQHIYYPQFFSEAEISHRRLHWEWPARAAHTLCVSTEFVAHSATEHLGIPRSRIILTPPPINSAVFDTCNPRSSDTPPQSLSDRLPENYLFYPSNTWPHKNHVKLLQALSIARTRYPNLHLVLTGWPQKAHKQIRNTIRRFDLDKSVTWLGYIQDEWMPYVYSHATALVFPSLFEGFGIPLLEAMHSDCPIICSATTSCPEVAGDAAIYFDPENPAEIADAIETIWTSPSTRDHLIQKGRTRRNQFDSREQSKALLSALRAAAGEADRPIQLRGITKPGQPDSGQRPLVSIIVPSYQQGRFIKSAIDSILDQDYPNIECVVIDGGSSDQTLDILNTYGSRIQWISEPDNGQGHAINKGLARSSGEIIGWLNSDDMYKPGAIRRAVSALTGPSGCWLVYGEADYIDEEGKRVGRYPTDRYSRNNLLRHCSICQPSVFFNRRLYEIGGGVDEHLFMAVDYELWLRYSKITPLLFLPDVLACSRVYPETKTSRFRIRSIKESMESCRKHYGRTSILWCMQYANARINQIPLVTKWRITRYPLQSLFFAYAIIRNELPYFIIKFARFLARAARQNLR